MKYRTATTADMDRIMELLQFLFESHGFDESLDSDWPEKHGRKLYTEKLEKDDQLVMVVEDDDQIVAYLVGGICEREEYRLPAKMSELEQMFVTAAYRSKGVGKQLVKEFAKWSKDQGVETIKVYANSKIHELWIFTEKKDSKTTQSI